MLSVSSNAPTSGTARGPKTCMSLAKAQVAVAFGHFRPPIQANQPLCQPAICSLVCLQSTVCLLASTPALLALPHPLQAQSWPAVQTFAFLILQQYLITCSASFPCRLKVHYRAAPGARGSGVERGHGQELPHCPLCLAKLDDVKYHKCAAGPAAQANPVIYQHLMRYGFTLLRSEHLESLPSLLRHLRCEVGSYYPTVAA
jgi:hypothetical protein